MKSRRYYFNLLILIVSLVVFSCKEDEETPIVPVVLVDSQLLASRTQTEIIDFIKKRNFPLSTSDVRSGVSIYKITYKSTFNGQPITASGLVVLPDLTEPLGMVSFQHGTIIAYNEAPSETPASGEILLFYATMAAPGFIGVVPDMFGFGASKSVLHPYYLEKPTADAVIDNLKAARELALVNQRKFNGKLFLAGYSQGGYSTMAAHKSIEENGLDNFTLVASFPSSGGYDIKGVQKYFFEQQTYDQPFYMAFVALAYKTHIGWTQPLTDFFQQPYAGRIPGLFNGENSGGAINAQLTQNIPSLVSQDLLVNIDTDTKYKYINDAFIGNSLTDWTPKIPMYMYHGDLDITVPYQNSVDVYSLFIKNGASKDVVSFTTLPYATHGSGVTPYLINFFNKLTTLK